MERMTILTVYSSGPKGTAAMRQTMPRIERLLRADGDLFGQPFSLELWDDLDWESMGLPSKEGWRSEDACRMLAERVRARPDIAVVEMWGGSWLSKAASDRVQVFLDAVKDLPIAIFSGTCNPAHIEHPGSFSLLPRQIDRIPLLERLVNRLDADSSVAWIARGTYGVEQAAAIRRACEARGIACWTLLIPEDFPTAASATRADFETLCAQIAAHPEPTHYFGGVFSLNAPLRSWSRTRPRFREFIGLNTGVRPDWCPPDDTFHGLSFITNKSMDASALALTRRLKLTKDFPKFSLDRLLLLKEASRLVAPPPPDASREAVFDAVRTGVQSIDARISILQGTNSTLWFEPGTRQRGSGEIRLARKLPERSGTMLHPVQVRPDPEAGYREVPVLYLYVDLLAITTVRIEDQTADLDLYVDLRSLEPIALEDLRIANAQPEGLSIQKVVDHREESPDGTVHVKRYRVKGSFTFSAHLECFPLDCQALTIEFMPANPRDRPLHIQGPPARLLDRDFEVPGWSVIDAEMAKHTSFWHLPTSIQFDMAYQVYEGIAFRWLLRRRAKDTMLFVAVPMLVLLVVSYFAALSTLDEAETKVQELAATMLATIALYFATTKPRSDDFTILDRTFRTAYLSIGGLLGTVLVCEHFLQFAYEWAMRSWLVLMPALFVFEFLRSRRLVARQSEAFSSVDALAD